MTTTLVVRTVFILIKSEGSIMFSIFMQSLKLIFWIFTVRSRVKIPSILLNAYHTGQTLDHHHPALGRMSSLEISELVQWSDMILFDYITGHYDR